MFTTAWCNQKLNGTWHVLAYKLHTGKTDCTWNSHDWHQPHECNTTISSQISADQ
jgi:hypothetical protein